MNIAIIGSGIAGLSAAWFLQQAGHHITLFEKATAPGMDAHAVALEVEGLKTRSDVPPRVFNQPYWPNLYQLYQTVGVDVEPVDATQSFSYLDDKPYLQFDVAYNPQLNLAQVTNQRLIQIMRDVARLRHNAVKDLNRGLPESLTLASYLQEHKYSIPFIYDFLYPTLSSTVCTCSYTGLNQYPAAIILEALLKLTGAQPLLKTRLGTQDVVQRLTAGVPDIRCETTVTRATRETDGVEIETNRGSKEHFDHLIIATQANQALRFLNNPSPDEIEMLQSFTYEDVPVVVHRDPALMPARRQDWAHINMITTAAHEQTMCSVWMNRFNPQWNINETIFQSIQPLREPNPDTIIARSVLQRPVVNTISMRGLSQLQQLHRQPGRRVWFCGSYAERGVPLLESAVISSARIALHLGAALPPGFNITAGLLKADIHPAEV